MKKSAAKKDMKEKVKLGTPVSKKPAAKIQAPHHKYGFKDIEDILNIPEEVKKSLGLGLKIVLILGILVVIVLIVLGIRVKFIISDELNLKLEPLISSSSIPNNETATINYTLLNDNFIQCKSQCVFTLTDLGNESIIYTGQEILNHKQERKFSFVFGPYGKGSSQAVYVYEVKCNNIKTTICPSDETPRYKTSTIIINYNLKPEELDAIQAFEPGLKAFFSDLDKATLSLAKTSILINRVPKMSSDAGTLNQSQAELQAELLLLKSDAVLSQNIWNNEEYGKLPSVFSASNYARASTLIQGSDILLNKSYLTLGAVNEVMDRFGNISTRKDDLVEARSHYAVELNRVNHFKVSQIDRVISDMNSVYSILTADELLTSKNSSQDLRKESIPNAQLTYGEISSRLNESNMIMDSIFENYHAQKTRGMFFALYSDFMILAKDRLSQNIWTANISSQAANDYCPHLRFSDASIKEKNKISLASRQYLSSIIDNYYSFESPDQSGNLSSGNTSAIIQSPEFSQAHKELRDSISTAEQYIRLNALIDLRTFASISNINEKSAVMSMVDDEFDRIIEVQRDASGSQGEVLSAISYMLQDSAKRMQDKYARNISARSFFASANLSVMNLSTFYSEACRDETYNATLMNSSFDAFLSIDPAKIDFMKKDLQLPDISVEPQFIISPPISKCCLYGECIECCDSDCQLNGNVTVPVIFIHGHTLNSQNTPEYTMAIFQKLQKKMQDDGYISLGELAYGNVVGQVEQGEWGRNRRPVAVRASFYYITHLGLGRFEVVAQKSERIENYAIRLKELIDTVKQKTGAPRVNIVAHSMGGLVAREYLDLFGDKDVGMLITINTPHNGISKGTSRICSLLGSSKECEDMTEGSIFLKRLNSRELPAKTAIYAIRSIGCEMEGGKTGDGVTSDDSGRLEGAVNYVIAGNCTDQFKTSLHTDLLDPDLYPQTYSLLLGILQKDKQNNGENNVQLDNIQLPAGTVEADIG